MSEQHLREPHPQKRQPSSRILVGENAAKKLKFASEPTGIGQGRSVSGEVEIKGAPMDGNFEVGDHLKVDARAFSSKAWNTRLAGGVYLAVQIINHPI